MISPAVKPMQILNMAIHHDEQGGLHAHIRRVWNTTDKDGNLTLGQNKALEAAGVELPEPDKKVSRYNNRKMTFVFDIGVALYSLGCLFPLLNRVVFA